MRKKGVSSGSRFEVFDPSGSNAHDERCSCPECSGLCQDDYEFFTQTGQYAPDVKPLALFTRLPEPRETEELCMQGCGRLASWSFVNGYLFCALCYQQVLQEEWGSSELVCAVCGEVCLMTRAKDGECVDCRSVMWYSQVDGSVL
jgi:hypothetical protein